ncbi:MAG: hypothetical protein K0R54_597 [Clostridiaceae bacterium]|jgi:hypothetical protein|nr:hypothetical protein [Clostridiaceae bacterium]
MNKINKIGLELIQYKSELLKDYPELVKKSLLLAIDQMVEIKVLDLDTCYVIKDNNVNVEEFTGYLYTKNMFIKSDEEILKEFEILRNILNSKLEELGILQKLKTESIIDKDIILASKTFCIDEQFTMEFFGASEEDVLNLMKRRGFIEKFAVLRLTKIFNDIKSQLSYPEDLLKCDTSLVYFDTEKNGYSIDFTFDISIELIEDKSKLYEACDKIKEIALTIDETYNNKIQI